MARRRYVPKTYNNRRFLRFISIGVMTLALVLVALFLVLFFVFQGYVVDGQLVIPWLEENPQPVAGTEETAEQTSTEEPPGTEEPPPTTDIYIIETPPISVTFGDEG